MNDSIHAALADTVEYLATLHNERIEPSEARQRLRALQSRHPDVRFHLIWEREAYDKALHYDVLVRRPDASTISMSVCAATDVPWPLRGAHRWTDAELLRVNSHVLNVQQAIACLDFIWDEAPVVTRLIDACLIDAELAANPVPITDEELQAGVDAFRRAKGLCSGEATQRWMEARSMTHAQLEALVTDSLAIQKLRRRITADRVETYYAAHRDELDVVNVARFECDDVETARRLRQLIRDGELDFYRAAEQQFVSACSQRRAPSAPTFATLRHRDVQSDHSVVRVLSREPSSLDDDTRAFIEAHLFDEWLSQRRATARIEWYWGNVNRTSR